MLGNHKFSEAIDLTSFHEFLLKVYVVCYKNNTMYNQAEIRLR